MNSKFNPFKLKILKTKKIQLDSYKNTLNMNLAKLTEKMFNTPSLLLNTTGFLLIQIHL